MGGREFFYGECGPSIGKVPNNELSDDWKDVKAVMSALVAASQTLVRHLPNSRSTSQNETPDRQHRSSGQSFLPSWPISKHLSKGKTTQAYGRRAGGVARSGLVRGGRRMLWRLSGNRHMQVLLDFVVFMTIWEVFREEFRSHTPSTFSEAVHPLLVYLGIRSPHQTRGQRLLRLLRRYGLGVRSAMFLGRRMRHGLMTARSFVGGLTLPRVRLPRSVHTSLDSCEDVSVVECGLVETPLWLVSASSAKHTKHTHSVGREITCPAETTKPLLSSVSRRLSRWRKSSRGYDPTL